MSSVVNELRRRQSLEVGGEGVAVGVNVGVGVVNVDVGVGVLVRDVCVSASAAPEECVCLRPAVLSAVSDMCCGGCCCCVRVGVGSFSCSAFSFSGSNGDSACKRCKLIEGGLDKEINR